MAAAMDYDDGDLLLRLIQLVNKEVANLNSATADDPTLEKHSNEIADLIKDLRADFEKKAQR